MNKNFAQVNQKNFITPNFNYNVNPPKFYQSPLLQINAYQQPRSNLVQIININNMNNGILIIFILILLRESKFRSIKKFRINEKVFETSY